MMWALTFSRPGVGRHFLQDDLQLVDIAMACLRSATAFELLSTGRGSMWYNGALSVVHEAALAAVAAGFDPVPELMRSGYFDIIIDALHAFGDAENQRHWFPAAADAAAATDATSGKQQQIVINPTSETSRFNVMSYFYGVAWNLGFLDLSGHPEATAKLCTVKSAAALHYGMHHDVAQLSSIGIRSAPCICMLCARLFGRSEEGDGAITFVQNDIDAALQMCQELLCPVAWGGACVTCATLNTLSCPALSTYLSHQHRSNLTINFIQLTLIQLTLSVDTSVDTYSVDTVLLLPPPRVSGSLSESRLARVYAAGRSQQ